ncbi:MAG TPA: aldo/keto reductase [Candidatus Acidoferrales bacterium]|nr:aldo/keto reductase [Candidatus Acidoferrales bacterium]
MQTTRTEYKQFGTTGLKVSRICFGTWEAGGEWGSVDEAQIVGAIRAAREVGINFFDTAQAYGFGASERLLGKALAEDVRNRRSEIVIATKGGLRKDGERTVRDASPAWLRAGVESSLKALGTDYIDLYQLHWPDPATPIRETAAALDALVREGKVRFVGVSNFGVAQMAEFAKTRKLDALQPPYHLFRRDVEREILPYCKAHGIGVLVYGPLAHGLLSGAMNANTTFAPDDWRSKSPVFRGDEFAKNLAVVGALKAFAAKRGISVAQLAIAWTLSNPAVDVAIVGVRNPKHVDELADASRIVLTSEDLREIDTIMTASVPVGGPSPEGM